MSDIAASADDTPVESSKPSAVALMATMIVTVTLEDERHDPAVEPEREEDDAEQDRTGARRSVAQDDELPENT